MISAIKPTSLALPDEKSKKINRYPGLKPFVKDENFIFFGRSSEIDDLLSSIRVHPFFILYSKSGLGKSSLIHAGVVPKLGQEKIIPIPIRFYASREATKDTGELFENKDIDGQAIKDPLELIANEIRRVMTSGTLKNIPGNATPAELFDYWNKPETPLLIFDQFEEFLYYDKNIREKTLQNLHQLVTKVKDISNPGDNDSFNIDTKETKDYFTITKTISPKFLFLIRSDRFYLMNEVAEKFPGILNNKYELKPLLIEKAEKAIELPAQINKEIFKTNPFGYTLEAIQLLLKTLSNKSGEIESSQLQIVCQELEDIADKKAQQNAGAAPIEKRAARNVIDVTDFKGEEGIKEILNKFYLKQLDKLRKDKDLNFTETDVTKIKILIENELVSGTKRIIQSEERVMEFIKNIKPGVEKIENIDKIEFIIGKLLDLRLIREEDSHLGKVYEISHDTLLESVIKARDERLIKEKEEKIRQQNERDIDKLRLEQEIKLRRRAVIITVLAVVMFIFAVLSYIKSNTKNRRLNEQQGQLARKQIDLNNAIERLNTTNLQLTVAKDIVDAAKSKVDAQNIDLMRQREALALKTDSLTKQKKILSDQKEILSDQKNRLSVKNEELEEKNSTISLQNKQKDSALYLITKLRNLALAIRHAEKSIAIPIKDSKRENIKAHLALVAYQLYLESDQEESKKILPQVYSALYFGLQNIINRDSSYKDTWQITPYQNTSDHLASGAIINNRTIYLTAEDKTLYSFDLEKKEKNEPDYQPAGYKLMSLEAGTKSWLTANTFSKKILFINSANRKEDAILNLTGIVRTSKFSPDGSILYVYTRDSTLSTINLFDKKVISKQKINFRIEDIAISDSKIYALTNTGDVVIWNRDNIPLIKPVMITSPATGLSGRGTTINCKPDNSLIVWGNDKGEVSYLKDGLKERAQYLTRFSGPVTSIAFNFSYDLLAIASYDKSIQVFSLQNLQSDVPLILKNDEGAVTSIFFQKTREKEENLVSVISTGIIRIYPTSLQSLACKVFNFYKNRQPNIEDLIMYMDKEIISLYQYYADKVMIKCD